MQNMLIPHLQKWIIPHLTFPENVQSLFIWPVLHFTTWFSSFCWRNFLPLLLLSHHPPWLPSPESTVFSFSYLTLQPCQHTFKVGFLNHAIVISWSLDAVSFSIYSVIWKTVAAVSCTFSLRTHRPTKLPDKIFWHVWKGKYLVTN